MTICSLNEPPYGTERGYNALRLAKAEGAAKVNNPAGAGVSLEESGLMFPRTPVGAYFRVGDHSYGIASDALQVD